MGGKGADKIDMYMRKGNRNMIKRVVDMGLHFRSLTRQTLLAPKGSVAAHVKPDITLMYEQLGTADAGVRQTMESVENTVLERNGKEGAGRAQAGVTNDRQR